MKRILFMHHISSIGGASYCMLSLLKGVDKRLFEPIVLLREYGPLADEIEKLGVTVIYWNKMSAIPYNKSLLGAKVDAIDVLVAPSAFGFEMVISILSLISDAFNVFTKPSVAF